MAHCRDSKSKFTLKEMSLSDSEEGPPSCPGSSCTVDIVGTRLVCVQYPAVVSNVDRMLDSIGGEQGLTKTYGDPSRRLEMRYRPQDPFCHSVCGNRVPSSNLLLRVTRRTRRTDPADTRLRVDVLGVIGTTYKFQGMADFQSLAVRRSEDGEVLSLYDKIVLKKSENQEFFEQRVALFLPPPIFSRLDNPVDYHYRPDIHHNQVPITRENFIGQNRARRPHNAIFVSFVDAAMPSACVEAARDNWERVCSTDYDRETEAKLFKMFEERPVWSRNAVKANLDIHPEKLKLLLPVCAYYMVTGPWRSLWIRLGYDPRKSPDSKRYQLLDFRIRYSPKHGFSVSDMPVKTKRSTLIYTLPTTFNKAVPQPASVSSIPCQDGPSTSRRPAAGNKNQPKDSMYIFKDGMLPPHRQMFYQLCDLHVQSIQDLVVQNDGQETDCDEKDGWCLPHTTDQLRDLLSTMIKKVMTSASAPVPLPPLPRQSYDVEEEEEEEDEEEDEEGDFQPSELGSENEMEAEMLDYM